MASLLSKFRIDYSALKVIPDISKSAQAGTKAFFDSLITDFQETADSKNSDDDMSNFFVNLFYEEDNIKYYIRFLSIT